MTRELSKIIHRPRQRLKGKYKYRKTARRIRNVIRPADLPFGAALMLPGKEAGGLRGAESHRMAKSESPGRGALT